MPGESRHDADVQVVGPLGQGSLMFFDVISPAGPVCFLRSTGRVNGLDEHGVIKSMTAAVYRDILFVHFLPYLERTAGQRDAQTIFQQDSAPIHKAKLLTAEDGFFDREGLQVAPWAPKSPDLNPIENVWGIMKKQLSKREVKSLKELELVVLDLWKDVCTAELCSSLYASMPARLRGVIKAEGHRISY